MKGKQKSARDMILSLGVIVLAAGVIWIFIPHDDGEPDVKRVDYRVELLTAQRAASYPVAAPEGLSEDWKPTSVRFRGDDSDAWHLGFRTPDGEYVAVEQSTKKRPRSSTTPARAGRRPSGPRRSAAGPGRGTRAAGTTRWCWTAPAT